MINNIELKTNADKVYEEFLDFTLKEMRKALIGGLRGALNVIKKDAKQNLRKTVKNSNKVRQPFNDSLQQGIRLSKIRANENGVYTGVVRSHSNNKHGSGSYRLPMLDGGTMDRFVKTRNGAMLRKPAFRGRITPRRFFQDAMSNADREFKRNLENETLKVVNKINIKKFG